jgi:hypothetical protein
MTDHTDARGRPDGGTSGEEDLLGPDLRALLSSLPKALPPERDLTEAIAAQTWDSRERLGAPLDAEVTKLPRRSRSSPWWTGQGLKLAAAAVALIAVTSTVTTVLVRSRVDENNVANATVAGASIEADPRVSGRFAAYAEVDHQYAAAIADLTRALEADSDRLPRATVQLIEDNLRVIDEAIQQSLAALESAPQSLPLQQALMTSYERKLDFLRQAAAITAEG